MTRITHRHIYPVTAFLITLAIVALVWHRSRNETVDQANLVFGQERISSPTVPNKDKSARVATNSSHEMKARDEPSTPESMIYRGENFVETWHKARELFGDVDPRIRSLEDYAAYACSEFPDPMGAVSGKYVDRTRAWAIDRTLRWCEGYANFKPEIQPSALPERQSPVSTAKKNGKDAGVSQALRIIESSSDYGELFEAGQFLIENNAFPYPEILASLPNLGLPELLKSWAFALVLRICDAAGGCGTDSIPTAAFCANAGCLEGVSLEEAYRQALPQREFEAAMAMHQWMVRKQGG